MVSLSERRTTDKYPCATGDAEAGLGGGLDTLCCPTVAGPVAPQSAPAVPDRCRRSGGGHAAAGDCATPSHRTVREYHGCDSAQAGQRDPQWWRLPCGKVFQITQHGGTVLSLSEDQ